LEPEKGAKSNGEGPRNVGGIPSLVGKEEVFGGGGNTNGQKPGWGTRTKGERPGGTGTKLIFEKQGKMKRSPRLHNLGKSGRV